MSVHTPVTPNFVTELVQRMRGNGTSTALSACESLDDGPGDDYRDVELAEPTSNGAGPLMAPMRPYRD